MGCLDSVFLGSRFCWPALLRYFGLFGGRRPTFDPLRTPGSVHYALEFRDMGPFDASFLEAAVIVGPARRSRVARSCPLVRGTAETAVRLW